LQDFIYGLCVHPMAIGSLPGDAVGTSGDSRPARERFNVLSDVWQSQVKIHSIVLAALLIATIALICGSYKHGYQTGIGDGYLLRERRQNRGYQKILPSPQADTRSTGGTLPVL
jgi:hypothetical protein